MENLSENPLRIYTDTTFERKQCVRKTSGQFGSKIETNGKDFFSVLQSPNWN